MAFQRQSLIDSMRERNDERKSSSPPSLSLFLCLFSFSLVWFLPSKRETERMIETAAKSKSSLLNEFQIERSSFHLVSRLPRRSVLFSMYSRRCLACWNGQNRKTNRRRWKNGSVSILSVVVVVAAKRGATKMKWNLIFFSQQIDGNECAVWREFEENDNPQYVFVSLAFFLEQFSQSICSAENDDTLQDFHREKRRLPVDENESVFEGKTQQSIRVRNFHLIFHQSAFRKY